VIVALVAAVAENGVIGRDGALPWSLPADLRRFRALTTGHHVVMGRKTHASIGRALPERTNLVLTRQPELVAPGCRAVRDLGEALCIARDAGESEAFVIGDGSSRLSHVPRVRRWDSGTAASPKRIVETNPRRRAPPPVETNPSLRAQIV